MSAKKIIDGLKDVLAGRVTRISVVYVNGERRLMTEAEEAAMDKGFARVSDAFDQMSGAMDEMFSAFDKPKK